MFKYIVFLCALCMFCASFSAASEPFPLPFTRQLQAGDDGNDVHILQSLLNRMENIVPINITGVYDDATANLVQHFQKVRNIPATGIVDADTATLLLQFHLEDHFVDPLEPLPSPYKYKVHIIVQRNRSIETEATLYNKHMEPLHRFTVRTHGQNFNHSSNDDFSLNELSPSGCTPTGMASFDLNSPEDNPASFGPYPVNRFVNGLEGNMKIVVSAIRDGLLMHTGEWKDWSPEDPMPNSHGCVHGHPADIKKVWEILTGLGVVVHKNSFGKLPYPYEPQGLISIELAQ
eukprot:GCRY01002352.1.p1 GENE.GCRY01002352.1~~GCRY01002352.1.p1  ORF type:complete len:289 (-),score=36.12 GCRY01002352.1:147-1013(-)